MIEEASLDHMKAYMLGGRGHGTWGKNLQQAATISVTAKIQFWEPELSWRLVL